MQRDAKGAFNVLVVRFTLSLPWRFQVVSSLGPGA